MIMKLPIRKSLLQTISAIAVVAILSLPSSGQQQNGIAVSEPKVFDNRSLVIMMENLNDSLRGIQFVDQKSLAALFGLLQGSSSRETVSSFSITPLPIPGLKQETVESTGNATTTGTPLPDTFKQTTTSDRPAFTPTLPGLDTLPAFSGGASAFGQSPSDLLSDQVNLTYQIFNLRMLLERSLSDRLLTSGNTRRQAVLGFNVSIDPPRTAEESVAVVEITLELAAPVAGSDGLSLVSLMPQEKTYNASALTTKSNSFGGSAVAKLIQVGYNQRKRGQTFYLYRDADTISYQRMLPDKNKVIFGWMFRPVLGRKSISPGMRQLFAIASLPSADIPSGGVAGGPELLNARVKTYWKKYDRGTMTSFDEQDATRRSKFFYGISLGLAKPEIFSDKYINQTVYQNIGVKATEDYQDSLKPKINKVWWVPVGPKSVLVSILGNNFFNGTQVTIGDRIYSAPAEGLIIKSNQAIDLTLPLESLVTPSAAIIGRYGPAIPLSLGAAASPTGISIPAGVELGPNLSGVRTLEVPLFSKSGGQLSLTDLPTTPIIPPAPPVGPAVGLAPAIPGEKLSPILTINGKVISPPYEIAPAPGKAAVPAATPAPAVPGGPGVAAVPAVLGNSGVPAIPPHLVLRVQIPDSALSDGGAVIKVSWPFQSEDWSAATRLYEPSTGFRILRAASDQLVLSSQDARGFTALPTLTGCWKLLSGGVSLDLKSMTCTGGSGTSLSDNTVLVKLASDAPDRIILVNPEGFPYQLDVPKLEKPETPAPKPVTLNQYDSVWIDINVSDFSKVSFVEADKNRLRHRSKKPDKPNDPVKAIQVEITRELTQAPGDVDVIIYDSANNPLSKTKLHIVCQICDNNGGK